MMILCLTLHILEICYGADFVQKKKTCVHVCTRRVPAHFYFKGFRFILLPKYHYHLYFWEGEGGNDCVCVCVSDMHFAAGIGPNF